MSPSFQIEGGFPLALTQAAAVAALLSATGTLAFWVFVFDRAFANQPPDATLPIRRRMLRLARASIVVGIVATLLWLLLQTADMAGAASLSGALQSVPTVVRGTMFGWLIAGQLLAYPVIAATLRRGENSLRRRAALALALVAAGLQAGHSHAASMHGGPSLLLASDALHLLAAGVWLGGLVPLLITVHDAPPRLGALAARWFSPMGKLCLYVLAVTAGFQGWVMVASVPGLVGTGYGWMALAKLLLFGVLFAFALVNRYRFAPALMRVRPLAAKRALIVSIGVQTGFGLAIIAAASVLSSLPPAMHVQPVWPFADRFSLDAVYEDPDFRREAIEAAFALAVAATLLVAGSLALAARRRFRWAAAPAILAIASAGVVAWLAAPHLDPLFVPAYPTSFDRSPTRFSAPSIVQGAAMFSVNCASCHGAEGRGDGPLAKSLPLPPANLTAAHLWMHEDGELFWWLAHGIEAPDGTLAMPGFAGILSDDDRWNLIDYIRARNAGLVFHDAGDWSPPLQAPALDAECVDGRDVTLHDLRGGFVRLAFGAAPAADDPDVVTILVAANAAAKPTPRICVANDEAIALAYAIVSGRRPEEMRGVQILIDAQGWLRAVLPAGAKPSWDDPARLAAEIRDLAARPIAGRPNDMKMPM